MIKWCLGIWDEENTLYYSYDKTTKSYFASTRLQDAIIFDKIKPEKIPLGVIWLPVFVPEKL